MIRQVVEGVRYAATTPEVSFTLILVGTLGTFGYNFTTILPLLARYVLHAGVLGLGMLTSALGAGSLIAALGVASARRTSQRVLLIAAALFAALLVLVGLSTWLPVTLALLVALGVASIVFSAGANTSLQRKAPNELRGRVMSLYFLLFAGTTPIGGFLVGVLSARFGVQPTVVLMGLICAAGVGSAALLARRRAVRGVQQHAPSPLHVA
jgi:MFS family permease